MANARDGWRNCILALLCLIPASAPGGTVETLDGRKIEGKLHFASAEVLIVTPRNAPPVQVALSDLLRADFIERASPSTVATSPRLAQAAIDENKGSLPLPWRGHDIGSVLKPGAVSHYHGTFSIEAHPRPGKARGDALYFVYHPWTGDGELIARVASLDPRDAKEKQARAGLMMRSALDPAAPNVSMSLSGGLGSLFRRYSRKGEKVIDDPRPDLKPPYWLKLVRENGTIAGFQSTDGKAWKLLASSATDLPERMLVGLSVTGRRKESARATLDHVALRSVIPRADFAPRVVLRDGTTIADHLVTIDEAALTFSKEKKGLKVRTAHVARVLFQPGFEAASLTPGRTGVLMSNGDFVDGEFRGLENGRVTITSVLFGKRSYDVNRKIAAVVLRDVTPVPADFELATSDGSLWHPRQLRLGDGDSLHFVEPLAGAWRIAIGDLAELRRANRR
jgi:hypothetical protein